MTKKICIIEPLSSASYLINRLKEEGFFTVIVKLSHIPSIKQSSIEYMRSDINYQLCDLVIECDYNNPNSLLSKLNELNINFAFYGCEYVVEFTDKIGKSLGLLHNNPETAPQRFNKYDMQESLSRNGHLIPKQALLEEDKTDSELKEITAKVGFPMVIKPVNSFASMGVQVIYNENELVQYDVNKSLATAGALVLQEKISGTEYLVDSFSHNGNHEICLVAKYEKELFNGNFLYRNITYINQQDPLHIEIINYIKKVLNSVGLVNGFCHSELFVTLNKEIFLIEVNPRISGAAGTINKLAKLCGGRDQINLLKELVAHNVSNNTKTVENGKIVFLYNFVENKIFNGIQENLFNQLPSYRSHVITKKDGANLNVGGTLFDSYVYIILTNDNVAQLNNDMAIIMGLENSNSLLI